MNRRIEKKSCSEIHHLCFCLQIPSKESNHSLGDFFTISTWMQHGEEKKDGHKEHILCNSDGDSKYSCWTFQLFFCFSHLSVYYLCKHIGTISVMTCGKLSKELAIVGVKLFLELAFQCTYIQNYASSFFGLINERKSIHQGWNFVMFSRDFRVILVATRFILWWHTAINELNCCNFWDH